MRKWATALVFPGLLVLLTWANWPMRRIPESSGLTIDRIVVEKSLRRMTLISGGAPIKAYSISLGRKPVGAKEREGDRKTPEGRYTITEHFAPSAFHRSLRISYPDTSDIKRARKIGVGPGSDIMIHGMRNGFGWSGRAHLWIDWTAGCIAVTNPEIEELWRIVPDGTLIEIRE